MKLLRGQEEENSNKRQTTPEQKPGSEASKRPGNPGNILLLYMYNTLAVYPGNIILYLLAVYRVGFVHLKPVWSARRSLNDI